MGSRDQQLVADCLSGRVDAFAELIRPYQDRVYNTLVRMTGNAEDAAELFQEAMIRVYRGLPLYHGDSSFYTWLYRIALNVAFTHRRRQRPRTVSVERSWERQGVELAAPEGHEKPGRGMELAETRSIIETALAQLAEPFRAVLVLKDIEGFRYEQIAEVLDIPVGTVRSRLHRARCEMREKLQPYLDNGTI